MEVTDPAAAAAAAAEVIRTVTTVVTVAAATVEVEVVVVTAEVATEGKFSLFSAFIKETFVRRLVSQTQRAGSRTIALCMNILLQKDNTDLVAVVVTVAAVVATAVAVSEVEAVVTACLTLEQVCRSRLGVS